MAFNLFSLDAPWAISLEHLLWAILWLIIDAQGRPLAVTGATDDTHAMDDTDATENHEQLTPDDRRWEAPKSHT